MKAIKLFAVVAVLFLLAAVNVRAASRLDLLKQEFAAAKARAELKLERDYLGKLTALRGRVTGAELAAVEAEIADVRARITALGGTVPPLPAAAAAAAKKTHTARDYVSNVKGWAGIPEFSRNNTYGFLLPEVGAKTTLTFYASGRGSTDTFGKVYLVTPDGKQKKIYRWSPDDFEIPVKEARNYRDLKPVRVDISKLVRAPGRYLVRFQYTGGDDPLAILRVEIRS